MRNIRDILKLHQSSGTELILIFSLSPKVSNLISESYFLCDSAGKYRIDEQKNNRAEVSGDVLIIEDSVGIVYL